MTVPIDILPSVVRGRDLLVRELSVLVRQAPGTVLVLHAAGGYGKTTVALAVAGAVADMMSSVWWVDASSELSLVAGLEQVALRAGAAQQQVREAWQGRGSAPDLLWEALNHWAEPWLLVLDNADDPALLMGGYRGGGRGWLRTPHPGLGTVMLTTRDYDASVLGRAELRAVSALDGAHGAQVLLDLAPFAGSGTEAHELSLRLGGLPLALHTAGMYLSHSADSPAVPGLAQASTFSAYIAALDEQFPRLMAPQLTARPLEDREQVQRTWEMSLDMLSARGMPDARPLLRLLSWFADAPVPCLLLDAEVLSQSPLFGQQTPQRVADLLTSLRRLGLLELRHAVPSGDPPVGDVVVIHPMIRETSRHQRDAHQNRRLYEQIRWLLIDAATEGAEPTDPATWTTWRAVVAHCTPSVFTYSALERGNLGDLELIATIAQRAALYFLAASFTQQARIHVEHAITLRTALFGPHHPQTLSSRHCLANVLREQGKFAAAEGELRQVLAERERVLVRGHPDVLNNRHDLARVMRSRGALAEAENEFREVLAARRRLLGADHPDTLTTQYLLAFVRQTRGAAAQATTEFRKVLAQRERVLGKNHPETVAVRHNLGHVLREQGAHADAEAEFQWVLSYRRRFLGAEHRATLATRHELAVVWQLVGRLTEAEAEYREMLPVARRVLGPDHRDTLAMWHSLATVLLDLGRYEEASADLHEVLESRQRVLGTAHPQTATTREVLDRLMPNRGE